MGSVRLPISVEGLGDGTLGEVNTKSIHIEPIEKACKRLAKPSQTLVHELKVHQVSLQIGHGIRQLCKGRLEDVERERAIVIVRAAGGVAQ